MIAYLDTSALLRIFLREPGAFEFDRLRLQGSLTSDEAGARLPIGSLAAIHLATALIWRDRVGLLPEMATHDPMLGAAACAFGFDVHGPRRRLVCRTDDFRRRARCSTSGDIATEN